MVCSQHVEAADKEIETRVMVSIESVKIRGPRIHPCGTPEVTLIMSHSQPSNTMRCNLSGR